MSTNKDTKRENDGSANAPPNINKNVNIFSTDMTKEMRQSIISVAMKAFHAPVNHGKVYQTIADIIRTECEKECGGAAHANGSKGGNEFAGATGMGRGCNTLGSGGWSCVVGDEFGSSVTHRMKTYIYFSIVPNVAILLWKS